MVEKYCTFVCQSINSHLKKSGHILSTVIWTIVSLYLIIMVAIQLPFVQSRMGSIVSHALSNKLGTFVEVEKVDLGLLTHLIADGILINDQENKPMLRSTRISAKVDILPLFSGKVSISSIRVFGLKANLYKKTTSGKPNFQFLIDSLAPKDDANGSPLELNINTIIIRNGEIAYHQWDIPETKDHFSIHHIHAKHVSSHLFLNKMTGDSLNFNLKNLAFQEQSGLHVKSLSFKFLSNKNGALADNFKFNLAHSTVNLNKIRIKYSKEKEKILLPTLTFEGRILPSTVLLSDFSCFESSFNKVNIPLDISADFNGTSTSAYIKHLSITSKKDPSAIQGNGYLSNKGGKILWNANFKRADLSPRLLQNFVPPNTYPTIQRLGMLSFSGIISGVNKDISIIGNALSDPGNIKIHANKNDIRYAAHIASDEFNLRKLLANNGFGSLSMDISVNGVLPKGSNPLTIVLKGNVNRFDFQNYSYRNIEIDGNGRLASSLSPIDFNGVLSMDDPNGQINLSGNFSPGLSAGNNHLTLKVTRFNPQAFGISNINQPIGRNIHFNLAADINGRDWKDATGTLRLSDFSMENKDGIHHIKELHVVSSRERTGRILSLNGDFGTAKIVGNYDYNSLIQSFKNILVSKLPSLQHLIKIKKRAIPATDFTITGNIRNTDWARTFFDIPLKLNQPVRFYGVLNNQENQLFLDLNADDFYYDNTHYRNCMASMSTLNDTLNIDARLQKQNDNNRFVFFDVNSRAADDRLMSVISFKNDKKHDFEGSIVANASFFKRTSGTTAADISIAPSSILIRDTVWQIDPANIVYSKKHIDFNRFSIHHGNQHLFVNGLATANSEDSLLINLQNIDVTYLLNMLDFDAVKFGGLATGNAYLSGIFSKLQVNSELTVDHFTFEDGNFGTLDAQTNWNPARNRIDIHCKANEKPGESLDIDGYYSPSDKELELGMRLNNANLEFLESYIGSFIDHVDLKGMGNLRLYGNLSELNLTGDVTANGTCFVPVLNTTYRMQQARIELIPDKILFVNDTIRDKHNHFALVNGTVNHSHLTDISFDVDLHMNDILAFDYPPLGNQPFHGTVLATGDCNFKGSDGVTRVNVNATPQKGTTFVYALSKPGDVDSQEFIQWNDKDTKNDSLSQPGLRDVTENNFHFNPHPMIELPSDLYLNFIINCNPDATFKLIIDELTGNAVTLSGNGVIRASYFNKDGFSMYGNYLINNGTYTLNIQNILNKNFQILNGGTISFSGSPENASLDLKALYTVNGVKLSDLNMGYSPDENNIRVDCLMNITGTPVDPHVAFSMDMPTVNEEEKQMIFNYINSEDEMNQQVIYLLTIGAFYTQDTNNALTGQPYQQGQATLAMQSILSGTISSQFSNLLSTFVTNPNWNFGANISTGTEGFYNAEYEGLLSGRLLDNRLLINGQVGYRYNAANPDNNFIGNFDIKYLLRPSGNIAIRFYNQTNDRYFSRNSLTTQGIGLVFKRDFNNLRSLFGRSRNKKK